VQVGRFGAPSGCGNLLKSNLTICGADLTPTLHKGPILVDLPTLVGIASFVASEPEITCTDNPAAHAPISMPTSTTFDASLEFSDGKFRRILDERAVIAVAPASQQHCLVNHNPSTSQVIVTTKGRTCTAATCSLTLSYPTLNASLSASAAGSVVVVENLEAHLQALDQPAKCIPNIQKRAPENFILKPFLCSSADYQQLTVCTLAKVSASTLHPQGRLFDVTSHANLSVSNTTAWRVLPNLFDASTANRLKPLSESRVSVVVWLQAMTSVPLKISAANSTDAVAIQEVALSWTPTHILSNCSYQCARTFRALPGTSQPLNISLTLSDDSVYSPSVMNLVQQGHTDVLNISRVLQFWSDDERAIQLSPQGNAKLLTNSISIVSLNVNTVCTKSGAELAKSVAVYGNLRPENLDFDAGAEFGPAFQGGANLSAPPVALQVCNLPCTKH
jgi:hypothetical protein